MNEWLLYMIIGILVFGIILAFVLQAIQESITKDKRAIFSLLCSFFLIFTASFIGTLCAYVFTGR